MKQAGRLALVVALVGLSPLAPLAQPAPPAVTFTKDVAPILFARCVGCHRPDGPAPFSLLTYDDAQRRAKLIATVTASRFMPPWKPEPGHGEFEGSRRLTDTELLRISQWVEAGTLEGDPRDLPQAPRFAAGWQLGEPDLVLTLPEFTSAPDGADIFRNFVIPVGIAGPRFVRGVELRTGNRAVHHATIRVDTTRNSRRLDAADPRPGYEGIIPFSAQYPAGQFVGWTPGQVPAFSQKGLSWRLEAGVDLVVQLHLQPTGKMERIQPAVALYFTREAPERTPVIVRLGTQRIRIPAGDAAYRTTDSFVLPVDVEVRSIQPHAHSRAREVSAWATLPDGSRRSLITITNWDVNWQDVYRYASPFRLPAGTRLDVTFTYDNSAGNPRNPVHPPVDVLWGPGSADEMGDVLLQVLARDERDHERLSEQVQRKMLAQDVDGLELQLTRYPDRVEYRNDLADAYVQLGQADRAVPHFQRVVDLQPQSAAARHNLGVALQGTGALGEAIAAYTAAVRIDPAYVNSHLNLGNIFFVQRRLADAHEHYTRAAAAAPDDPRVRQNLELLRHHRETKP